MSPRTLRKLQDAINAVVAERQIALKPEAHRWFPKHMDLIRLVECIEKAADRRGFNRMKGRA